MLWELRQGRAGAAFFYFIGMLSRKPPPNRQRRAQQPPTKARVNLGAHVDAFGNRMAKNIDEVIGRLLNGEEGTVQNSISDALENYRAQSRQAERQRQDALAKVEEATRQGRSVQGPRREYEMASRKVNRLNGYMRAIEQSRTVIEERKDAEMLRKTLGSVGSYVQKMDDTSDEAAKLDDVLDAHDELLSEHKKFSQAFETNMVSMDEFDGISDANDEEFADMDEEFAAALRRGRGEDDRSIDAQLRDAPQPPLVRQGNMPRAQETQPLPPSPQRSSLLPSYSEW